MYNRKKVLKFLVFVERCDWLQRLRLMNIFQHVRFR